MAAQDRGQFVVPGGAAGAREPDPRQAGERVERDAFGADEFGGLPGRQQHAEPFSYDEQRVELRPRRPLPQESDVELTGLQGGQLFRGGQVTGLHPGVRMSRGQLRQRRVEQSGGKFQRDPDPQGSATVAGVPAHRP
jgi:hypothetical protein